MRLSHSTTVAQEDGGRFSRRTPLPGCPLSPTRSASRGPLWSETRNRGGRGLTAPAVGATIQAVAVPEASNINAGLGINLRHPDITDQPTETIDERWRAERRYRSEQRN